MLDGTLSFAESMLRPVMLDKYSCDFGYPLHYNQRAAMLKSTKDVRMCYRSHRVSLLSYNAKQQANIGSSANTSTNMKVYVHNTDKILEGAVRVYLWRKPFTEVFDNAIVPLRVYNEDLVEMVVQTQTNIRGIGCGSVVVDASFDSYQIVVMQPCSGVSVYLCNPTIFKGLKVTSAENVEQPLTDVFDSTLYQNML